MNIFIISSRTSYTFSSSVLKCTAKIKKSMIFSEDYKQIENRILICNVRAKINCVVDL